MCKHILAAVDFSPAWPQVEAQLSRLSPLGCEEVTLAYVIAEGYTQAPEIGHQEHYESKLEAAAKSLASSSGHRVSWTVRIGPVAPELISAAREAGADTLLAGRRGHGIIRELLLGSTALDLMRLADRPLLLAPIGAGDTAPSARAITRPLLATDGSIAASGAEAAFVHLASRCDDGVVVSVGPWESQATIEQHIAALKHQVEQPDTIHVEQVVEGKPSEEIIRVAKEKEADLIIIGRRGQNRIQGLLLGSTAEAVCRASRELVLLVPERA